MALVEAEFVVAIEDFATQWQRILGESDRHDHSDWDDVRVLERVCLNSCRILCVSGQRVTKGICSMAHGICVLPDESPPIQSPVTGVAMCR